MEKLICDVIQWNYDTDEMWNDEKNVFCVTNSSHVMTPLEDESYPFV